MDHYYQKYVDIPLKITAAQYEFWRKILETYNDFYYSYLHLISLQMVNKKSIMTPDLYYNEYIQDEIRRSTFRQPIHYISRRCMIKILRSANKLVYLNRDRIVELHRQKCLQEDKLRTEAYKWIKSRRLYNPKDPTVILQDVKVEYLKETCTIKMPKWDRLHFSSKYLANIPDNVETAKVYVRQKSSSPYLVATLVCNVPQQYDDEGFIQLIHKEDKT